MRSIRALTTGFLLVTALPGLAAAQQGRQFKDAWFWGVKAGGFTFADSGGAFKQAPLIGVEWLITRTQGGLYIAGSQTFMSTQTVFPANPGAPDTLGRTINLKNMRRLDVAIMGFPGTHIKWHPYVGAGFSMSQVPTASGEGPFNSQDELESTQALIQQTKVGFSPLIMAGTQYRMQKMSVFGQVLITPTQKDFILYNGRQINVGYEIGIRYNVGTSIAKD